MKAPEGWSKKRLAEIAQLAGGTTPSKSQPEYWDGQYCWATPSDVTALSNGTMFIEDTSSKITDYALEGTSTKLYEPGTVMMTSRATIGYAVINEVPMATNQGFCNFMTGIELDDLFFAYWLRHKAPYLERLASGSTFKEISKKTLRSVEILLPPLPEQKKIAEILGSVDEAIQATQETIEQTKRVKKGLLQDLLTKGIGHTRFKKTEIGEIPEEWVIRSLQDLIEEDQIELGRGNVISKKDIKNTPGSYPVYSSSTRNNGLFGRYGKYMFEEEMITWSIDGGGDFFYRPIHKYSVTNVCGYMHVKSKELSTKYLHEQLAYLHRKLTFDYQRKAHPSVIRNLYTVPIPPLPEQNKIAEILGSIDDKIQAEHEEALNLERLKKGLMQDLLSGRVRVSV